MPARKKRATGGRRAPATRLPVEVHLHGVHAEMTAVGDRLHLVVRGCGELRVRQDVREAARAVVGAVEAAREQGSLVPAALQVAVERLAAALVEEGR